MIKDQVSGCYKPARFVHLILICVALSGCDFRFGPSSDDDDGNSGGGSNGQDGGASIGILTDASDLEVNFDSDFSFASDADIFIDGEEVNSSELANGMVVQLTLEETVPADLSDGTVTELQANHLIIGPVTQVSPLQVLNQEITVLDETEIGGITGENTANLIVGDVVRVSGYANRRGGIVATRIDNTPVARWKLTGSVSENIADSSFEIHGQLVTLNGTIPSACGTFGDSDYAEVYADPIPDFEVGDDINSVSSVACITESLPALVNTDEDIDSVPAEMEGFVLDSSSNDFEIGDQEVIFGSSITYINGRSDDMEPGAQVIVRGSYDLSSRELTANQITFSQRRFFIEAPLVNEDITADAISIFGASLNINNLVLSDDDEIISGGLLSQTQVSLSGFVDENQIPYITQVEQEGSPEPDNITLLGPVSQVGGTGFDILGISVDGNVAEGLADGGSITEEDVVLVLRAETDNATGITTDTDDDDATAQLITDYVERDDRD